MTNKSKINKRTTLMLCLALIGTGLGVFVFLVMESHAPSYLSNDSRACANCHVMLSAYNTWSLSSHSKVAQCNDCHIPQQNFIKKYLAKALDGGRHTYVFTTNTYSQVLITSDHAKQTIQENCMRCHSAFTHATPRHSAVIGDDRTCWSCHRQVPHGTGNSITSRLGLPSQSGLVRTYQTPQGIHQ